MRLHLTDSLLAPVSSEVTNRRNPALQDRLPQRPHSLVANIEPCPQIRGRRQVEDLVQFPQLPPRIIADDREEFGHCFVGSTGYLCTGLPG